MAWHNILEQELISIKWDDRDQEAIIEVNDGGIAPSYVTLRLEAREIDQLIGALNEIQAKIRAAKRE
ncbi:hypothetical protein [Paenibacillus hexagrammi]|uniref:Uncharacterized protein n=1 Tax=Paenibacillus hexagrammi TaxID=2908839 RepID=A0ABY3SMJ9_9BACL|nr:hypothetical protein [Paenibacillus sp. YPD9-1]UJF34449.1 hypothetical protein L0M14_04450 [Paenibacillus sp. YPD9-1]